MPGRRRPSHRSHRGQTKSPQREAPRAFSIFSVSQELFGRRRSRLGSRAGAALVLVVLALARRSRFRSRRTRFRRVGVSSEGNSGKTENSGQQKSDVFHSNFISLGISLVFSASDVSAGKTEGFLGRPSPRFLRTQLASR